MRKTLSDIAIAAQVVGTAIGGIVVVYLICLFAQASSGEQLTAVAAIVGGVIGAAGAAIAVYLTLAGQRKDDAQKVEAALRQEVAEFGRLAHGALGLCELVLARPPTRFPLRDLPTLMAIPEAVVYKATADRISRLPYGALFVIFHDRVAEAGQLARTCAISARPFLQDGRGPPEPLIADSTAKTLATAWFDVCMIARTILRRDANAAQLADQAIDECLKDLDALPERIRPLLEPEPPAASP
jgi:hypothetical protein